jgi:RNA polymerase sigma-70 factor, ECF subfamily
MEAHAAPHARRAPSSRSKLGGSQAHHHETTRRPPTPPQLAPPATSTSCSPSPKAPPNLSTNSSSATNNPSTASSVARTADPHHAEELSQETFLVLLRAAARYEPRALFRTYLYAIAFKILRAHRRKAAFRATFIGQPKSIPDPAKQDATESGLWVRRAVEKLDRIDREVLLLREFEQLSYAEIADLLQLPINTVRSRLFRARTALRDLLEPAAAPAPNEAPPSAEPAAAQTIPQKGIRL